MPWKIWTSSWDIALGHFGFFTLLKVPIFLGLVSISADEYINEPWLDDYFSFDIFNDFPTLSYWAHCSGG